MAFAYFIAHAPQGFWPIVNRGELAALYSFVFLYFAAAGGGPWSVDHWWRRAEPESFDNASPRRRISSDRPGGASASLATQRKRPSPCAHGTGITLIPLAQTKGRRYYRRG